MPKMKTHKGAKRRFKVTGSGKLVRMHRGKSHLRRKKPRRVTSQFDDTVSVSLADYKRLGRVLPYAGIRS
ncbi:MAG TPA: 50S ribosomal protein L35 [Dehalococcoidia bacterium]|nr:50S ribosomal protein L35 [Dehalococcoidia bacterium]